MEIYFFNQIAQLAIQGKLHLVITQEANSQLVVSVLLENEQCSDPAKHPGRAQSGRRRGLIPRSRPWPVQGHGPITSDSPLACQISFHNKTKISEKGFL